MRNQTNDWSGKFRKTTRTSIRLLTNIHIHRMIRHLNCCGVLSDHHQRLPGSYLTQVSWSNHLDLEAAASSSKQQASQSAT
jgi:hypothetical protein